MHNLADEVLCARWLENPYYQFFCGELSFCHALPFDRSSLTLLSLSKGAPALGRRAVGGSGPGKPVGGAPDRGIGDARPRPVYFVSEDWRDGSRLWHAIEWLKQRLREEAQLVPVVHGRDARGRTTTAASLAGRRVGGACG